MRNIKLAIILSLVLSSFTWASEIKKSTLVAQWQNVNFSANIATTTIITTTVPYIARYRLSWHGFQTAAGSGGTCTTNASFVPKITIINPVNQTTGWMANYYNPESVTPTFGACNIHNNTSGTCQGESIDLMVKASTAITYEVAWGDGNCTTQPTASIYWTIELLE